MSWARLPAGLSSDPAVLQIERAFGLAGYARLVKMLEMVATLHDPYAGRMSNGRAVWLDVLQAQDSELDAFLQCLASAGLIEPPALTVNPLVVQFCKVERFLPDPAPALPTDPQQWAFWLQTELNMPRPLVDDPHAIALFRRWTASNVTVTEMNEAVTQAVAAKDKLTPAELHKHVHAVRTQRLNKARN